jgi:NAD(P)-dependent dehydrogenase (short-subunit alcohol dehydrogenase family)
MNERQPDARITLITGGTRGLGREAAARLRDAGHHVYIGARSADAGAAVAAELGVDFVQLDVTDDASVREAAAQIERREGRLDVLVNNAGIPGPYRPAADITAGDALAVFDTNVFAIVRVTHEFLPLLEKSDSPVIVNVGSSSGSFERTHDPERIQSKVSQPLYSASKAALTMLTTQYARALPHIRINVADPGFTATEFNGYRGTQNLTEGTDAIVAMATIGPDGPTGAYLDRHGPVGW